MSKKFLQYGAGNIGRGFIGQLLFKAGYEVVFVDVVQDVINQINTEHAYPVRIVSDEGYIEETVTGVRAVDGMNIEVVAQEISTCDLMATAVGVHILPRIVGNIVAGIRKRWEIGNKKPLNILICENLLDANKYLEKLIKEQLSEEEKALFDQSVGLVEASIGRMVPVMTKERQEGNILRVWVEKYAQLPLDAEGFIGEVPEIPGMFVFQPFEYYIRRKLFIHNMGHAVSAYLGFLNGDEYIYQSIKRPEVRIIVQNAMQESAIALYKEFGVPLDSILEHVDDLLFRFGNRMLGDTVARVGNDPIRKLASNDRFVGALLLCEKLGLGHTYISLGIAAGLCFQVEADEAAQQIQSCIAKHGVKAALSQYSSLEDDKVIGQIVAFYDMLKAGKCLAEVIAFADHEDSIRRG